MAMNFGPLIPYAAPVNNVFNSTQMWGGNPFSGPFNQMPATINYPNVLFLPFGGSPVNLQPPANLLQTPGVGPFLSNPGLFGSSAQIPAQQSFGGPPPFTLDFASAGFANSGVGGFGAGGGFAQPGFGAPAMVSASPLMSTAQPMFGAQPSFGAPAMGAAPIAGAAPMIGGAAPMMGGFSPPPPHGGGQQGGMGQLLQTMMTMMMTMMQMVMQLASRGGR